MRINEIFARRPSETSRKNLAVTQREVSLSVSLSDREPWPFNSLRFPVHPGIGIAGLGPPSSKPRNVL